MNLRAELDKLRAQVDALARPAGERITWTLNIGDKDVTPDEAAPPVTTVFPLRITTESSR